MRELPPEAMGGFDANRVQNLAPEAMAGMDAQRFGACHQSDGRFQGISSPTCHQRQWLAWMLNDLELCHQKR